MSIKSCHTVFGFVYSMSVIVFVCTSSSDTLHIKWSYTLLLCLLYFVFPILSVNIVGKAEMWILRAGDQNGVLCWWVLSNVCNNKTQVVEYVILVLTPLNCFTKESRSEISYRWNLQLWTPEGSSMGYLDVFWSIVHDLSSLVAFSRWFVSTGE